MKINWEQKEKKTLSLTRLGRETQIKPAANLIADTVSAKGHVADVNYYSEPLSLGGH